MKDKKGFDSLKNGNKLCKNEIQFRIRFEEASDFKCTVVVSNYLEISFEIKYLRKNFLFKTNNSAPNSF